MLAIHTNREYSIRSCWRHIKYETKQNIFGMKYTLLSLRFLFSRTEDLNIWTSAQNWGELTFSGHKFLHIIFQEVIQWSLHSKVWLLLLLLLISFFVFFNKQITRLAQTTLLICWAIISWFGRNARTAAIVYCIWWCFIDGDNGKCVVVVVADGILAIRIALIGDSQVIVIWKWYVLILFCLQ